MVLTVNPHAVVKIIAYALLLMVLRGGLAGQVRPAVAPYLLQLCVTNDCNRGFLILGPRGSVALRCGDDLDMTERPWRERAATPKAMPGCHDY